MMRNLREVMSYGYDAALVLSDDGTKSVYSLDFGKE